MWTKTLDEVRGEVVFRFSEVERPLRTYEREGSDVTDYFHPKFVANLELGSLSPNCLRLRREDISYPKAIASFYVE